VLCPKRPTGDEGACVRRFKTDLAFKMLSCGRTDLISHALQLLPSSKVSVCHFAVYKKILAIQVWEFENHWFFGIFLYFCISSFAFFRWSHTYLNVFEIYVYLQSFYFKLQNYIVSSIRILKIQAFFLKMRAAFTTQIIRLYK